MTDVLLVLTTVAADFDVAPMTRTLVEEGYAACVSVSAPMASTYRWQGAIETAVERQVVIKTTQARLDALTVALRAAHPYEVPELIVLPVAAGGEIYLQWVRDSTMTAL